MKNRIIATHLSCILLGLASCQNETMDFIKQENDAPMSVIARIGHAQEINARYAGEAPNNAEFAPGDSIGIFMDNNSLMRWEYKSMTWESDEPVYWPDKDETHTFRAFYPYTEALSYEHIPMPSLKNQDGSMASVAACDFLVASTSQTQGTDGTVMFQGEGKSFKHVSSLVSLFIKPQEDLTGSTLKEISIEGGNIAASGTYSFTTGKVSLLPYTGSEKIAITPNRNIGNNETNDIPYYFVVNETLDADNSSVTLTIKYQKGNDHFTAKVENFASSTFAGGNQYLFSITIKNNNVLLSGNTIEKWETGNTLQDIIINSSKDESEETEES